MIHERASLTNVEKFEYLQSYLKGDALCVIKHIKPANDNYLPAWELIKKKYNNNVHIKRAYLQLLFDQPSMKGSSVEELSRLVNKTHENINALKALNEPVDKWDSILVFHLERKLDSESHMLWCRETSTTFEKFIQFLEQRLLEVERCKIYKPNMQLGDHKQRNKTTVHMSNIKVCPACNSAHHPIYNCETFKALDVAERIKLIRQNHMFFNCFDIQHQAGECKGQDVKNVMRNIAPCFIVLLEV